MTEYYSSTTFKNFSFSNINIFKYKAFQYSFNQSNKKDSESYYFTEGKSVDDCKVSAISEQNYSYIFKDENNFLTYSCRGDPLFSSNVYYNEVDMEVIFY